MRSSPPKVFLFGFGTLILALVIIGSNMPIATAQDPVFPTDFLHDNTLYVYAALNGQNVIYANTTSAPVVLDMENPMLLTLQINVTSTQDLNMSGSIVFYYQGIEVFPITVVDSLTHSIWIWVDHTSAVPVVNAYIDFASLFNYGPLKLLTGVIQASMEFRYYRQGNATENILKSNSFYISIPAGPTDILTSVTGITTTAATVGVIYGVGNGFWGLFDGLKTAYKLRGIHKKASEIKSLPNLTVLGALPLLFSMLAGMSKIGRKKKQDDEESKREDSSVSEYIIRQRLRETAPDAWRADKCPKCKRDWNKKLDMCKKCNLTHEDAQIAYADLLATKVPIALKVMGKKKSANIRTLAKKTKSTDYNAGVIAAAMVDTEVSEIVKVGTPFRSFIMNIAGLAFLVITWQQLLGDNASTFQTTITVVGAAMSLAVIIALYVSRKTQIQKFQSQMDTDAPSIERIEESVPEIKTDTEEEEPSTETSDEEEGGEMASESEADELESQEDTSSDHQDFSADYNSDDE